MIHLRITSPSDTTDDVVRTLRDNDAVCNLVVEAAPAGHPAGDAIRCDVLNGAANSVLEQLRALEVVHRGSVVAETVDAWLSDTTTAAERRRQRFEELTPIWALVDARVRSGGIYPPSWFALLLIAGVIGAIGILTNSQILIVAAMVVGPEYGAMVSVAHAATQRDRRTAGRGLRALLIGFTLAVVAAAALGAITRGTGRTPHLFEQGIRPVSDLIAAPNYFSVTVAVLAGVVGVLSLTESRMSTLIGVCISVTTIPAAADIGLSAAYGSWSKAQASLLQLLLNVTILIVVGIATFIAQRRAWNRVTLHPIASGH